MSLHDAIDANDPVIVETLIKDGANIEELTINGFTPLQSACNVYRKDTTEIVRILIKNGANFDVLNDNNIPLILPISNSRFDIIELLVELGADVNKPGKSGITALHRSCMYGNYEIVKYLIDNGAEINVFSDEGSTPLFETVINKRYDISALLINKGANNATKNRDLLTPLHILCASGNYRLSEVLIVNNNANISVKDCNGRTPLHFASYMGEINVVKMLVRRGADISIKSFSDLTPLQELYSSIKESFWKLKERKLEIAELLESKQLNSVSVPDCEKIFSICEN